jgi:flagellar capping protein FliD
VSDIDSRLEKRRATLLAQYAKFEATLGRLKAIGDSLTSQLSGLNRGKDD